MIPIPEATAAGVLVANVPGANAVTVAEHVIFTAMALLRRFRIVDRDLRSAGWNVAREHSYHLSDLSGLTIGIVGMGNLGHAIFKIAHGGFGMDVIANSRRRESLPSGARFAALDDLVAEADIVVLCCPLTPQTTGLMSRERIARHEARARWSSMSRAVRSSTRTHLSMHCGKAGSAARRLTFFRRSRYRWIIPSSASTM